MLPASGACKSTADEPPEFVGQTGGTGESGNTGLTGESVCTISLIPKRTRQEIQLAADF